MADNPSGSGSQGPGLDMSTQMAAMHTQLLEMSALMKTKLESIEERVLETAAVQ